MSSLIGEDVMSVVRSGYPTVVHRALHSAVLATQMGAAVLYDRRPDAYILGAAGEEAPVAEVARAIGCDAWLVAH